VGARQGSGRDEHNGDEPNDRGLARRHGTSGGLHLEREEVEVISGSQLVLEEVRELAPPVRGGVRLAGSTRVPGDGQADCFIATCATV